MAGIGFELRKILRHDTFVSELKAYAYSALVSSGPWVMSVSCLAILGLYRIPGIADFDHEVFRATVTTTFAFSLIYVGIYQLVFTRYLADRFYENDERITIATFITFSAFVLVGGMILAFFFYLFFPLPPLYKMIAIILYEIVCMIWVSMIFISAVKNYDTIVYAFAVGVTISILGSIFIGRYFGICGYLLGYTIGQAVILFWLLARLLVEFPPSDHWNSDVLPYFKKYWDLAAIGFLYNLAIWVDKFVFWHSPSGRVIVKAFITHDLYEIPAFYSYLTIIPTLAIFLVRIETDFYDHYRAYYSKVTGKAPLDTILEEKTKMAKMIIRSIRDVFVLQGGITLLCIIFAAELIEVAGMSPMHVPIFRICLIGSFLLVMLSITIIVLFYFDLRMRVLITVVVLLILNTVLSYLTTVWGYQFYGYGYTYAYFVSLILAFYMLYDGVKNLEFITFARQPI